MANKAEWYAGMEDNVARLQMAAFSFGHKRVGRLEVLILEIS